MVTFDINGKKEDFTIEQAEQLISRLNMKSHKIQRPNGMVEVKCSAVEGEIVRVILEQTIWYINSRLFEYAINQIRNR